MQFAKKNSLLFLGLFQIFFSIILPASSDESDYVSLIEKHSPDSFSECHHHNSTEVLLNYKSPKNSSKCSIYGIYISVLNINTENVSSERELFKIVHGAQKKASFKIHLKPKETIVAFVVSFDHNFDAFIPEDVGTLVAKVNGTTTQISLINYEMNAASGFFSL